MDYYKNQNYYDILGIKEDADFISIEKAKNRLKFGSPDDRAPFSMWDKIDEAYNVLSDSDKRKEYDEMLKSQTRFDFDSITSSAQAKETEKEVTTSNKEENINIAFVSPFIPEQKKQIKNPKLEKIGKIVLGGTLVCFSPMIITNGLVIPTIGVIAGVTAYKKFKLHKEKKVGKIKGISNSESKEIENYNKTLDGEINKLLSQPHNNYKLEINRLKYKNQINLLEKLLEMRLSREVKGISLLKYKLDIVATKMQLETAKQNLQKIEEEIELYESKNSKKSSLANINKKLIQTNQELNEKRKTNSYSVKKLKLYKKFLVKRRDSKANKIKFIVVKSGKMYDSILKAKDFVVSVPYIFKSEEKVDEFLQAGRSR